MKPERIWYYLALLRVCLVQNTSYTTQLCIKFIYPELYQDARSAKHKIKIVIPSNNKHTQTRYTLLAVTGHPAAVLNLILPLKLKI